MIARTIELGVTSVALAAVLSSRAAAQDSTKHIVSCDSVLRAARVDSVEVTARAYLVRRDGRLLPPRARMLLLESILAHFEAPKPLRLPVFSPGPAPLRMLRVDRLSDDSTSRREPVVYGVYGFWLRRSGSISKVEVTIPTMAPGFDEKVVAAIHASAADSVASVLTRALDVDSLALDLRMSTGPEDSRFRVPAARVFEAAFPLVRLVDAKPSGVNPLPEYPDEERDEGRDGEVLLRVIVDGSGGALIPTLEVVHATSPAFARSAARALARYHFTPAHVSSCSVPQVIEVPFWFSLRP